jgi:hypothetical protein
MIPLGFYMSYKFFLILKLVYYNVIIDIDNDILIFKL